MRSDPSDHQSRSGPDGVTIEQPDAGSIDAFAAAFDREPGAGLEPYVRLVPPDGAEVDSERSSQAPPATPQPGSRVPFDPEDIERREYRLLARALTNGDPGTDHLAAMTLVQLVSFCVQPASASRTSRTPEASPIRAPPAPTALIMPRGSTPVPSRSVS